MIRVKDKLGKSNLSFGIIVSDTGFLNRKLWVSVEVLQPASAMPKKLSTLKARDTVAFPHIMYDIIVAIDTQSVMVIHKNT